MTYDARDVLTHALDNIAETKSEEDDPFVMGVLAGVEDAIEVALTDIDLRRSMDSIEWKPTRS